MKILRLEIGNFMSIDRAALALDDRGLVLVQGENRDDPSATSNGAGKSSVADALFWALYGETARGVSGDAVVNKTAGKNCRVAVTLRDGDQTYEVVRHRKHKEGRNSLRLFHVMHPLVPGGAPETVDMTKGTERESQKVIEQALGCSVEVFRAAVYSGQEAMPDLPGMTDKQLKVLIEEAAGIDLLQQAYEIARGRLLEAKRAADSAKEDLAKAEYAVELSEKALAEAEGRARSWELDRDRRVAELASEAEELERSRAAEQERLSAYDESALDAELAQLDLLLAGYADEERERDRLSAEVRGRETTEASAKADRDRVAKELRHAREHLSQIESKVGSPCGECGRPYRAEDLGAAREIALKKIEDEEVDLRHKEEIWEHAAAESQAAGARLEAFKASMTDVSATSSRQQQLRTVRDEIRNLKSTVERLGRDSRAKLTQADELGKAANPHQESVAEASAKLVDDRSEVITHISKLDEARGRLKVFEDAVSVFGPAGVRAHILDTVTPFLNDRTAGYLGALSDGQISAVWSTLSKTAKGEPREKFVIDVVNAAGAESFAGLSGGERRKVRLACALALQDLVGSRATKPVRLWVGDEIDDALDQSGLERLMGIMEEKARERGTVLVISHNSLSDWINEQVLVVKEGGLSTVSGGLCVTGNADGQSIIESGRQTKANHVT